MAFSALIKQSYWPPDLFRSTWNLLKGFPNSFLLTSIPLCKIIFLGVDLQRTHVSIIGPMLCYLWSVCVTEFTFVHKELLHCLVQLKLPWRCVCVCLFVCLYHVWKPRVEKNRAKTPPNDSHISQLVPTFGSRPKSQTDKLWKMMLNIVKRHHPQLKWRGPWLQKPLVTFAGWEFTRIPLDVIHVSATSSKWRQHCSYECARCSWLWETPQEKLL